MSYEKVHPNMKEGEMLVSSDIEVLNHKMVSEGDNSFHDEP